MISRIFINHLYGIEYKPYGHFFFWGGGPPSPPPTSTPVVQTISHPWFIHYAHSSNYSHYLIYTSQHPWRFYSWCELPQLINHMLTNSHRNVWIETEFNPSCLNMIIQRQWPEECASVKMVLSSYIRVLAASALRASAARLGTTRRGWLLPLSNFE